MKTTIAVLGLALVLGFAAPPAGAAAEKFTALHEVLRHFEVAFVEKANLNALATGALRGLLRAVPGAEIRLEAAPKFATVTVAEKSETLLSDALHDFKALEAALVRVANLAVSAGKADKRAVEHGMLREMVGACGDIWSVFLEQDIYSRLIDDGTKVVGDVGLLFENVPGGLRVLDAVIGGPAYQDGIRAGMKVDRVAGRDAASMSELEALALCRGKPGDKVELTIAGKARTLTIAEPPKQNIRVDVLPGGFARVHLLDFRADTGKHLAAVLPKIAEKGGALKGLVLDLRGNPGGLVTEGTAVVGLFINGGTVVTVKKKKQMGAEIESVRKPGPWKDLPLVLLTDHRSASVSEIVALALRDHERAKIVGEKTLGKGTVQVVMELSDGAAIKLSTGRYYSPKDTPLYEGIEPDVEVAWDGRGEDLPLKKALSLLRK
jgi:carboxyl-terminal processing protease